MVGAGVIELVVVGMVSSLTTSFIGWLNRRKLVKCTMTSKQLIDVISEKGVDLTHGSMEAYIVKTYERLSKLGEGASGIVERVKNTSTGEVVALKTIQKGVGEADKEEVDTEIRCLRRLRHRNIVNLVEAVESESHIWIVMECADGGGLYDRIISMDHFSEKAAAGIIKQVLRAVHYMHSMGVVHRDLKPENVLLDTPHVDAVVKVADFGLATELGFEGYHPEESMRLKESKKLKGGFCGSPICMAPEVAKRNATYGPQCDIWSVGCMTHELVSGKPPFTAANAKLLFKLIREQKHPSFDGAVWKKEISQECRKVVTWMLEYEPKDRPSAKEALGHSWFEQAPGHHLRSTHDVHKSRRTNWREEFDDDEHEDLYNTLEGQPHLSELFGHRDSGKW